ncbi:hypothetical protein AB6V60_27305, partial [Klebsiella pneumoniae]
TCITEDCQEKKGFFFKADDGIRDGPTGLVGSEDVYKKQVVKRFDYDIAMIGVESNHFCILFR